MPAYEVIIDKAETTRSPAAHTLQHGSRDRPREPSSAARQTVADRRRRTAASPTSAVPTTSNVAGSGTDWPQTDGIGVRASVKNPTICPRPLMPFAVVAVEPSGSIVVKTPPLSRKTVHHSAGVDVVADDLAEIAGHPAPGWR